MNSVVRDKAEIEAAVRDVLTKMQLAEGMTDLHVNAGFDSSGDPAVHLTVTLRAGNFTDAELTAIHAKMSEITRRILDLDLGSFPYFRIEQAA